MPTTFASASARSAHAAGRSAKMERNGIDRAPRRHVLGSAMLLAYDGNERLLYTGDFKLGPSATAEEASPPTADVLVMESTFGDPKYRLPPRTEVVAELLRIVTDAIDRRQHAGHSGLRSGKSQEVTKILTNAGIRVLQHPLIHQVSQVYEKHNCCFGDYAEYRDEEGPGKCAVVVPPMTQKAARLRNIENPTTIAVTGWAMDPGARFRLRVDYAVPLSDHADYDDLIACVELVQPKIIYCTHAPSLLSVASKSSPQRPPPFRRPATDAEVRVKSPLIPRPNEAAAM